MTLAGLMPMDTVNISLLASRRVDGDLIHTVVVWTDFGQRHVRRLHQPVRVVPQGGLIEIAGLQASEPSAGTGWCTWRLPSMPPSLRDVQPRQAAESLAHLIGRAAP